MQLGVGPASSYAYSSLHITPIVLGIPLPQISLSPSLSNRPHTCAPQVLNLECPDRLLDRGFSAQRDIVAFADSTGVGALIRRAVQLTCRHTEGHETASRDDVESGASDGGEGSDGELTRRSQDSGNADMSSSNRTRNDVTHDATRQLESTTRSTKASVLRIQEEDFAWEQGGDGGGDGSRGKRKAMQQRTLGFSAKKPRLKTTPRVRVSRSVRRQ